MLTLLFKKESLIFSCSNEFKNILVATVTFYFYLILLFYGSVVVVLIRFCILVNCIVEILGGKIYIISFNVSGCLSLVYLQCFLVEMIYRRKIFCFISSLILNQRQRKIKIINLYINVDKCKF